jgi:Domain of Unknown Function (DUF928)
MLNSKRLLISGGVSAVVALEVVGIMGLSIDMGAPGALTAIAARPRPIGRKPGSKRGVCPSPAGQSPSPQAVVFLPASPLPKPMLASTATPTLYFYIPDRAEDLGTIELRVSHGDDTSDQMAFPVHQIAQPKTPGVLKVPLTNALKPGVNYTWTLSLKCKTSRTSSSNFSGSVTYAPIDAKLMANLNNATSVQQQTAIYIAADRWIDAIPLLMEQGQLSTQPLNDILTEIGWDQPIDPDSAQAPAQ